MKETPDFGDCGNGPEDPYTPDEEMRRFYFMGNSGTLTLWGTARVPPSWTVKRIREHGLFAGMVDVSISFDVRLLKHVLE